MKSLAVGSEASSRSLKSRPGVGREPATLLGTKAISITVASIMATTSTMSMSTTTLTTGSYVTASSSLAVGGGRTTMTMGITARGCAVRPPSPVAHTGGGATSCVSATTKDLNQAA